MPERATVVLVDPDGTPRGESPKRAAHEPPGERHLAFSVFLFSPAGHVLLQQRAASKYHFPGIWANSCCSHPAPGEELLGSAELRVLEELGIGSAGPSGLVLAAPLVEAGCFEYRAVDPVSGLVEHEVDHVLVGRVERRDGSPVEDGPPPAVDPAEIGATRWAPVEELRGAGPEAGYAPWFAEALEIALRPRP
jgi:isopentenyl-diphosphate delta-isomerase